MNKFIVTSNTDDIIDSSPSRAAPARGRRAKNPSDLFAAEKKVVSPSSTVSNTSKASPESSDVLNADRPKRRRQMWDVSNDGEPAPEKDVRLFNAEPSSDEESIPVIPDLDDANEEEVMQSVAVPPAVFQELLSYRELDSDLMRQSAFSMLDNEIDLKLLTKSLVREMDLIETEEPWEMNQLFAEMQSLLLRSQKGSVEKAVKSEDSKEILI